MFKWQINYLDELFRKVIEKRANKRCEFCLYHKGTEIHYFFNSNKQSTCWDITNAVFLCKKCYYFAENHRKSFREEVLSKDVLEKLELRANTPAKLDFDEVREYLEGYLGG